MSHIKCIFFVPPFFFKGQTPRCCTTTRRRATLQKNRPPNTVPESSESAALQRTTARDQPAESCSSSSSSSAASVISQVRALFFFSPLFWSSSSRTRFSPRRQRLCIGEAEFIRAADNGVRWRWWRRGCWMLDESKLLGIIRAGENYAQRCAENSSRCWEWWWCWEAPAVCVCVCMCAWPLLVWRIRCWYLGPNGEFGWIQIDGWTDGWWEWVCVVMSHVLIIFWTCRNQLLESVSVKGMLQGEMGALWWCKDNAGHRWNVTLFKWFRPIILIPILFLTISKRKNK